MDPDLDPDPTPNTTPFFNDFKDAKNYFFSIFFSHNLPAGTLTSVLNLIKLFEKREGSGSVLKTNGSGSGCWRPRNMWILRVRIPKTAINNPN
jgi:hypothetical protein